MFQLADRPHLFPGYEILGETAGKVVDTGIELPVGGRVYLGKRACAEAARLFGFAAPAEADALKAAARAAELRAEQAEQRLSAFRRLSDEAWDEAA